MNRRDAHRRTFFSNLIFAQASREIYSTSPLLQSTMSDKHALFDTVFPKTVKAVRAASALAAQDINFYTSLDKGISSDVKDASSSLLALANKLLSKTTKDFEFIEYGEENIVSKLNWKRVSDVLDTCFEKADLALDEVKNPQRALTSHMIYLKDSSDEKKATEVKVKPQENFRSTVDNSDSLPFKPRLENKPYALKSLEESLKLRFPDPTDDGKVSAPHYAHPYEFEIMNQPYPELCLQVNKPVPSTDWATTAAKWVDTVDALQEMIEALRSLTEIAIDLEHHDYRSYYGITCLMQISNREQDWIVDTLALHDDLRDLNEIFANPAILKVLHGANMDIIWLQRDLGLYIVSLFDTYHASKKLGFPKFSLAYLLENFAHFKTSKKYQLADWRIRPLTDAMMQYARADTHFLLNIYDQLRNKLLNAGQGKVQEVLYESRKVASRRFEFNSFKQDQTDNWMHLYGGMGQERWVMNQYNIEPERIEIVQALINWRDKVAREKDESTRYIMLNQVLANLSSLVAPVDASKVHNAAGSQYLIVRQNSKELAELIEKYLATVGHSANNENVTSFDLTEVNYDKASEISKHFTDLTKSVPTATNLSLSDKDSRLLSKFAGKSFSLSAESFEPSTNERIRISQEELMKRATLLLESLAENLTSFEIENEKSKIDNMEEAEEKIDKSATESPQRQSSEEDKDAIVVLSGKKSKKSFNKKQSTADEELFDYSTVEEKVLANVKNGNTKKRSFDPFSRQGTGPKAAKRSRNVPTGKSTSFVKKRN